MKAFIIEVVGMLFLAGWVMSVGHLLVGLPVTTANMQFGAFVMAPGVLVFVLCMVASKCFVSRA